MTTSDSTPPAEWASHAAIWTAWPADADLWKDALEPARAEVAAMVHALTQAHPDGRNGDKVCLLVMGEKAKASAATVFEDLGARVTLVAADYGDIWLRDTGPIFQSRGRCARFRFNGWGGKYELPHDDAVGDAVVAAAGAEAVRHSYVLEGGAIDWDGEGAVLTTRECLLNPNRNPDVSVEETERALYEALGFTRVLWLERGLLNDHTDGHVDNIARFVAPGVVVCQSPTGADDPNAERLNAIASELAVMRDARGRLLQVIRIPSPGRVVDADGRIVPASHANFLIGNATVVVPTYDNRDAAAAAVAALQKVFPDRLVVGLPARHILTGGGAFHCITQQQPA